MEIGEWCTQRDTVYEDKYHRCSKCGRRLKPQLLGIFDYMFKLPKHKKKGYKIKRKKGHNKRKDK